MHGDALLLLIYYILPDPIKGPVVLVLGGLLLAWAAVGFRTGRVHYHGAVFVTLDDDGWLYWVELGWRFVGGVVFVCLGIDHFFR
jgi:hypothetical protein